MQLSKAQHKIMLLYARLMELRLTQERLEGGGRILQSDDSEPQFLLETGSAARPERKELVGVRKLRQHSAVRKPQPVANLSKLDCLVSEIFPWTACDSPPVSSDSVSVQDFAERIGFRHGRGRYIIDYIHASELPTYSAVAQKNAEADRFTERYGGLYYLYRHDLNSVTCSSDSPTGKIVRASMSIRYPVPYKPHESDKKGESRIRCKLVLPAYGDHNPAQQLAYDGYVGPKGRWHQFLFQARRHSNDPRTRAREDLILMYTEELPGLEGHPVKARGVMMTQNQEEDLTPTVSSIVITRVNEFRVQKTLVKGLEAVDAEHLYLRSHYRLTPDDERGFMTSKPVAFDPNHPEVAEAALDLFKGWNKLNTYGLHR